MPANADSTRSPDDGELLEPVHLTCKLVTLDEKRIVLAYRRLPGHLQERTLRDLEVMSANFPADGRTP